MFNLSIISSFSNLVKGAQNTAYQVIMSFIRIVFYGIDSMIYKMLRGFCNVFFALCNGQLLDNDAINSLFGRVGLLLGKGNTKYYKKIYNCNYNVWDV